MAAAPDPLLSTRVVRALYYTFTHYAKRDQIRDLFYDHGFEMGLPVPEERAKTGERRGVAQRFLHYIDLTDQKQVKRLIALIEDLLSGIQEDERYDEQGVLQALGEEGYDWRYGRLVYLHPLDLSDLPLEEVNEGVLREHLDRLTRAHTEGDIGQVIGSSKEIIESTCRLVLRRFPDADPPRDDDVPALTKAALKALQLDAGSLAPTPETQQAVTTILRSLGQIPGGMAHLRNKGGTGHGREQLVPLDPRHADLAYGAALTFTRFVLATLHERQRRLNGTTVDSGGRQS